MSEYQRYPLTMSHPHFQPSVITEVMNGVIKDYHGTPVKFPPVVVNTEQDEEYHASQGYEPAGKIDPSAWIRAHETAADPAYKPQKYPMVRGDTYYATAADDPDATEEDLAELRDEVRKVNPLAPISTEDPRIAQMQAQIEALTAALTKPKPRGRPKKVAAET